MKSGIATLLLLVVPFSASAGIKSYCNEVDLTPDLTQNNDRFYVNPNALGCDLGVVLPGLGKIGLSDKACDKVQSKTNNLFDKVASKLNDELDDLEVSAKDAVKGIEDGLKTSVEPVAESRTSTYQLNDPESGAINLATEYVAPVKPQTAREKAAAEAAAKAAAAAAAGAYGGYFD